MRRPAPLTEVCVLSDLRDRLRAGDVWVRGSRRFKGIGRAGPLSDGEEARRLAEATSLCPRHDDASWAERRRTGRPWRAADQRRRRSGTGRLGRRDGGCRSRRPGHGNPGQAVERHLRRFRLDQRRRRRPVGHPARRCAGGCTQTARQSRRISGGNSLLPPPIGLASVAGRRRFEPATHGPRPQPHPQCLTSRPAGSRTARPAGGRRTASRHGRRRRARRRSAPCPTGSAGRRPRSAGPPSGRAGRRARPGGSPCPRSTRCRCGRAGRCTSRAPPRVRLRRAGEEDETCADHHHRTTPPRPSAKGTNCPQSRH